MFADDHLSTLMQNLPAPDAAAEEAARARDAVLTKPPGALGRLEDLAIWLAAWQGRHPPRLDRIGVRIFAGNHGVTAQGISAFPAEVTGQMVANFETGGAAINQLCRAFDLELTVTPLDLEAPTEDFTTGPAMSETACREAFEAGMRAVDPDLDLLCPGEMGIGNTTAAAALCTALFGGPARQWAGPGTGLDDAGVSHKADVIDRAIAFHGAALDSPWAILRHLGGREIAAMAGAILAARVNRIPVLLDGFVCSAAAAVLAARDPGALAHCRAGHCSAEPAHRRLLERLDLRPLLDLGMRLGEASGAATAAALVRAAVATHNEMASFAEAGVAGKEA